MGWVYIQNEKDIFTLQEIFTNFSDSEIVQFTFTSGNYVDAELVGHECMKNDLNVTFQRSEINPFSIELAFEEMKRINFEAPLAGEYTAELSYAKLVMTDQYIYWTNWRDFNPLIEDHLKGDVTYIEAKRAKWRILS